MVSFDSTTLTYWIVGFFVLAALGAATGLGVVVAEVLRNRRVRLARRQNVRTYYRGLVLSH
jgi:hypothetical protein